MWPYSLLQESYSYAKQLLSFYCSSVVEHLPIMHKALGLTPTQDVCSWFDTGSHVTQLKPPERWRDKPTCGFSFEWLYSQRR